MNFRKSARPVIMGGNGMVSAGHSLGALAGVRVLQEGGNAVDAALAAAFAMASLLALLALVTLAVKTVAEWRMHENSG